MSRLITKRSKKLYHYTDNKGAERIITEGCLKPYAHDNWIGFVLGKKGIAGFRYDVSLDSDGNTRRGIDAPCIFLTESYPYFETGAGRKWGYRFVFPVSVGEVLDQGLKVYKSPRLMYMYGNNYIIPDPELKPLRIDVSKAIKLGWKWRAYACGISPFTSPIQGVWRMNKNLLFDTIQFYIKYRIPPTDDNWNFIIQKENQDNTK